MRLPRLTRRVIASLSLLLPHLAIAASPPDLPALTDSSGPNAPAKATTAAAASKTAAASKPTPAKASQSKSPSAAASTDGKALPALTSSGTDLGGLQTGLPKLAGDNYPAPSVPPTADAPFMQKSNLPEGTVFICVGAALALIALTILAWRGIVAWSLHRSVRKTASKYTYIGDAKSRRASGHLGSKMTASPFAGSTLTLDQFPPSSTGKSGKPSSGPASRNSLFFSPTASHTAGNSNLTPASNRASAYLPAGYYAANAQSSQHQQGISMSNLNPNSTANNRYSRHSRSIEPSPPPSSRGERSGTGRLSALGSNLNLSNTALVGAGGSDGRAPSTFLEDLFESSATAPAPAVEPPKPEREKPKERDEGRRPHTAERRREGERAEDSGRKERRRSSHGERRRRSSHRLEGEGRRRENTYATGDRQHHRRRSSRAGREEREQRRRSGY